MSCTVAHTFIILSHYGLFVYGLSFFLLVCLFFFFAGFLNYKYLPEFLLNSNFWLTPFVPIQQHIDYPQMHVLIQAIVLVQKRYEFVLVYGMVAKGNRLHKEKTENNNKIKFHFHNFM